MSMESILILIVLLISHIAVLQVGLSMGAKTTNIYPASKPSKEADKPYHDPPDIYDEEMLDIE